MRYMMLIYGDETGSDQVSEADLAQMMTAYNAFTDEGRKAGVILEGEALHPTRAATTVRVQDGKTLTTDGPFAETKEALGGYYIWNALTWMRPSAGQQRSRGPGRVRLKFAR